MVRSQQRYIRAYSYTNLEAWEREDCRNAVFRSGSRNKLGRLVISRGKKEREDEASTASSGINTEYPSYLLKGLRKNLGLYFIFEFKSEDDRHHSLKLGVILQLIENLKIRGNS